MKYSVVTFGCRVNQADSLRLEEDLRARGATASASGAADLVIVNTCSVTATADQGARQAIRRVSRDNPSARIVVTGCYATRCADDLSSLPAVLRVVPNSRKREIVDEVFGEGAELAFADGSGPCGRSIEPGVAGRTAFTLRVQTGCEERCSYCIIPSTRGRGESMPVADVVRELVRVVEAGFREVVITGVHLGSYGRDLAPASSLAALLTAIAEARLPALFRVSSLEPMDCTGEVVELLATYACFAPHLHLPLQHASNRMLRQMARPYTFEYYRDLIGTIAERIEHVSIGTDLIAGFPGETDEDFQETVRYLESSPLSHVHVFPYSDRPGTAASALAGKVPGPVIRQRGARLRELGAILSERFRSAQVGTIRRGLTIDDGTVVVTDNYLKVRLPAALPRNAQVRVRIAAIGSAVVV